MKCWRCGKEIEDGMSRCIYCQTDQQRPEPVSDVGRAMRMLYDRYGAEAVLGNPVMLANGIADVISDTLTVNVKKLKNTLKMALDAGIGRLYLDQLADGAPDAAFDSRIRTILTDDAGLNDKTAAELIGYFDEMIGWRSSAQKPEQVPDPREADYQTAFHKMDSQNVSDLQDAIRILRGISGYKDADRLAVQCRDRIDQLQKEEIYQQAKKIMDENGGYEKAIFLFERIPGYRDADSLRRQCQRKLDKKAVSEEEGDEISKGWICAVLAAAVLLIFILVRSNQDKQLHQSQTATAQYRNYTYGRNYDSTSTAQVKVTQTAQASDLQAWAKTTTVSEQYKTNQAETITTAYLSGKGNTIPEEFEVENGVLVNYQGSDAEVVIPEGIKKIGDWAFGANDNLKSITIPYGVTSIGDSAFLGCSNLTSVKIANSVTSIGNDAFNSCESLISITIPDSVTVIEGRAFSNCKNLKSVSIPNSVTVLGADAFRGCTGLTSVTLSNRLTSISDNLFWKCTNLKSIIIPDNVTSIGAHSFYHCESLNSIVFPDELKSIGINAFEGCKALGSVTLPASITSLSNWAFGYGLEFRVKRFSYAAQWCEKSLRTCVYY